MINFNLCFNLFKQINKINKMKDVFIVRNTSAILFKMLFNKMNEEHA